MKALKVFLVLGIILLCNIVRAEVYEVEGFASGGTDRSYEDVRLAALQQAKMMALERAGTVVFAKSEVDMGILTKDEIKSATQGFVKVLEVKEKLASFDPDIKSISVKIRIKAHVDVTALEELLKSIKVSTPEPQNEISFEITFVKKRYLSDGTYIYANIPRDRLFHSGEEFCVRFIFLSDGYLYIINEDSAGNVDLIFPGELTISNELKAGMFYILPSEKSVFKLDETSGREILYFIASSIPMDDIRFLLKEIKGGREVKDLLAHRIKTRGIHVVEERLFEEKTNQVVGKLIKGRGAALKILELEHE